MADEDLSDVEARRKKIEREKAQAEVQQFKEEALKERERTVEKKENKIERQAQPISKPQQKRSFLKFIGLNRVKKLPKRKSFLQDRIKVMRYRNMLEKQRLKNLLTNYKLKNRVELLRRQGKLPAIPIPKITIREPYFASPQVNRDLASVYDDTYHSPNDKWGDEDYFGGEAYYDEQFFHDEFLEDPLSQLGIKPKSGVNPLFW